LNQKDQEYVFNTQGIKVLYRRLLIIGYTKEDASNLIAKLMGLEELEKGWTVKELTYLKFYKELSKTNDFK
jgi:hypothetical protein